MSIRRSGLAGGLLMLSAATATWAVEPITIALNGLEMTFDGQSGGLQRLGHAEVGVILDAPAGEAGLLDVAYPVEAFLPLRLAVQHSRVRPERRDNGMTLHWEPLGPSRAQVPVGDGKVVARVLIDAADDGRSVLLRAEIDNRSASAIPQVLFPDLRGLVPLAGEQATWLRLPSGYPVYPFTEPPIPTYTAQFYVHSGWREYPPSVGTYGSTLLRWVDFGGYGGGLSVFERTWGTPDRPTLRTHRSQTHPDRLRMLWDHAQTIAPGASWTSHAYCLTPHPGGWAKGIEVFRDYVHAHHPPRPGPPRVRDGLGFRTVFMIQAPEIDPERADFRFSDLPALAAEAKAHGLTELCLWGWCDYFTLPYALRRELGTREEFLEGVAQARTLGVEVVPFVSNVLVRNAFADRYGGTPGGPAWVYHPELVPMMDPYYLGAGRPLQFWNIFSVDPHNANWQADTVAAWQEWLDAGVTSWSWDQFFADAPDSDPPGMTDLLLRLRGLARAKDPEATLSGESVTSLECDGGVIDYTWNWADYTDSAPVTTVMPTPRLNCNIEDSPRIVKAGFADNLFLNAFPRKPDRPNGTGWIADKPELSAALKEVSALRERFLPWFVEGRFIGDSLLAEPAAGFIRAYVRDRRMLVIVLNNTEVEQPIRFSSRLDLWLPPGQSYQVREVSPDGQARPIETLDTAMWNCTTPPLAPLALAFVEVEAMP